MDAVREAMGKVLQRCDICLNGNVISKELLLTTFSEFVLSTMEKKKHNIGIILHTGSACFDALLLSWTALSDILYNKTSADDVIFSLEPEDIVLYYSGAVGQRYYFKGFENGDNGNTYVVLQQDDKSKRTLVGKKHWSQIIPYNGNSTSMDGKGLRRESKKRYEFLKSVLEMEDSDISRTTDTSTVVVMPRNESNELINGLSFRFGGTDVKLTELVPISYYTENGSYSYEGNPAKAEPVIKIAGNVSMARTLMLRRGGNKNIGLVIMGNEAYRRGELEIPELLSRQSIQYIYLCLHIDSEMSGKLINEYEDAEVFACTKDFLLSNSLESVNKNSLTLQLDDQINAIIDKEINEISIPGFPDWESYKAFQQAMLFIKSSDYSGEDKDNFVIQAYSLMNLFLTAVFSMEELERYIDEGRIANIETPARRFDRITAYSREFPEYLRKKSETVLDILETAYMQLYEKSDKEEELFQILKEAFGSDVVIVVPKAYYAVLIESKIRQCFPDYINQVEIVTSGRFDNTRLYDLIVVVGNISETRFDVFRCRASRVIDVLLCDAESYKFRKKARNSKKAEHILNQRSTIELDDEYEETPLADEDEINAVEKIDEEMSRFSDMTFVRSVHNYAGYGDSRSMADVIAAVKFDTGGKALLSKNYKAYVLDEKQKLVKEVGVTDLREGDTIVFTRSSSKTRDIVEFILQYMVENGLLSPVVNEAYYKSRQWKTTLVEYMKRTGDTAKSIAERMIRNGVSVQANTIMIWLDEDAHMVRPRKEDSIQQIALVAGDEELFDHSGDCYRAGTVIYGEREKIRAAIGQAILRKITGQKNDNDRIASIVSDKIEDAAVILNIETIVPINESFPINVVNRPLSDY